LDEGVMQVFVSYSRQDSEFVDQLVRDLKSQGVEVWIDREDLRNRGGARWQEAIAQGIRDCDAFILVMSPRSAESRHVRQELSIAFEREKRVIPVVLEHGDFSAFEYQTSGLQWIDFTQAAYPPTLAALVGSLQEKPPEPQDEKVEPVPPLAQQLAGTWQLQGQNMGMAFSGQVTFYPNGGFAGTVGPLQVQAMWGFADPTMSRIVIQGQSTSPMGLAPYNVLLQITSVGWGTFNALASDGAQVAFQRIG
jgi:hypothetical protein